MSVQAMSYVLDHSRAEHSARLVLLSIANHANDENLASAAVATYGRETRLGERTVQGALRELVASGEIESAGMHPKYRTTLYRMLFPALQATFEEAESAPPQNLHPAEMERDSAPEPKASGVPTTHTASTSVVPTSAPTARAKRDAIFEVLFELDAGLVYTLENRRVLTEDAAGVLNKAAKQIADTGIEPDELRAAIAAWPDLFTVTATAAAVKKHLPRLRAAANGLVARRATSDLDDSLEQVRRMREERRVGA